MPHPPYINIESAKGVTLHKDRGTDGNTDRHRININIAAVKRTTFSIFKHDAKCLVLCTLKKIT